METMNTPRNPKIRGKMSAKKAVFQVLRLEDLGLDPDQAGKNGSATKVTELFAPESHPIGTMISGDTVEQAATKLVETLASKQLL
jgi:electron transfer flavoprotein beta subunit